MYIKIKNISSKVTADSLAAVFSTYGHVLSSTLVPGIQGTNRQPTATIVMPDEKEATTAIEQLNGRFVDGQAMVTEKMTHRLPVISCLQVVRGLFSAKQKSVSNFR